MLCNFMISAKSPDCLQETKNDFEFLEQSNIVIDDEEEEEIDDELDFSMF